MSETTADAEGVSNGEIKDPKAVLAALERAKADAKRYREQAEALQTKVSELEAQPNTWRERVVAAEAKLALNSLGIKDTDRLLKYLDTNSVTLDEEGKVTGLTEAVEALKVDFPELFEPKRRVGNAADIFADGNNKPQLSDSEVQAKYLLGA